MQCDVMCHVLNSKSKSVKIDLNQTRRLNQTNNNNNNNNNKWNQPFRKHNWLRITSSSPRLNGARATLRASTWGRHLIWRAATASFAGFRKPDETLMVQYICILYLNFLKPTMVVNLCSENIFFVLQC
jgi:hypothetical protein